jgi:hypothetical protein
LHSHIAAHVVIRASNRQTSCVRRTQISLVIHPKPCYVQSAFVALVTPLDSIEGAASSLAASFALRLEAVEKHK